MPRTVLEFPDKVDFSTDYTIVIGDINRADHLGADRLFTIMIEAQMRLFHYLGYSGGTSIEGAEYIMADSQVIYQSESKYGDELQIDVAVCNFGNKSFEILYRFFNKTKNRDAALMKAGMVFFDYQTGRAVVVPQGFRDKFSG